MYILIITMSHLRHLGLTITSNPRPLGWVLLPDPKLAGLKWFSNSSNVHLTYLVNSSSVCLTWLPDPCVLVWQPLQTRVPQSGDHIETTKTLLHVILYLNYFNKRNGTVRLLNTCISLLIGMVVSSLLIFFFEKTKETSNPKVKILFPEKQSVFIL